MADNGSRSFQRDGYPRDNDTSQSASDPLAELARLIGQSESYGGSSRDAAQTYDEATPLPELDWAAGDQHYAEPGAGTGYAPPPAAEQYRDERGPPRYTAPAGFAEQQSEYADQDGYHDQTRPPPGPPSLPYISPLHAGEEQDADRSHGRLTPTYGSDNPRDEYDDHAGSAARRRGTIIGLAILGVVVLGTAGAFGYRAMFGGSFIPSLPPIITPGNTPIKILPQKDAQAAPGNQTTVPKATGEQLVPHQEQPVEVQAANPPPRVITTIPVISNAPVAPMQDAPSLAGGPPATMPALPGAPSGQAQPIAPPSQLSEPASDSKRVHTVIIKPDQAGSRGAGGAPTGTASATVKPRPPATRPAREPRVASAGGPLSIVPGHESAPQSPAPRTRTATAHSGGPMPLSSSPAAEAAPARGGGYAVQVSSQRSEGEAETAFRSLQAKYPRELGSHHATIRRADLGAKGVYYRALVGPFASAEQASSLCSSLKAAGGSCIVQRN
jgi:SPOR domain